MSLKKQFLKTKDICKVTFALSAEEVKNAKSVNIVGEFNNWNEKSSPLKKFKNGNFKIVLDLEKGKQYQFKYIINGTEWQNDTNADLFVSDNIAGENSVVITE